MHIIQMFDRSVRNHPSKLAFTGDGGDFTYRDAQVLTNKTARACLREGFGRDARVSLISPNNGKSQLVVLGAMRANMVWCNINLRDTPENIVDILKRDEVNLLFYHSMAGHMIPLLRQHVNSLKEVVCIDQPDKNGVFLDEWIEPESDSIPDIPIKTDDIGLQASTGGTTGRPKIAVANHSWTSWSMMGFASCLHFNKPPVYLSVAPITHAGGVITLFTLTQGGTNVMMAQLDLDSILNAIQEQRISLMFLPPTLTYMILKHPMAKKIDYSSLEYFISTSAPIAPEKIAEVMDLFGPVFGQMYGQSESGVPNTYMSPQDYMEALQDESKRHRLASCGKQTQIVEAMEILDEDDHPLGPGVRGEIAVKGPTVMLHYLKDPEATAEIQSGGWHHTGDIGYRDEDGFFYIVDRKRDMIVSGGFNIYPFEIEQVLLEHPKVVDCCVIGVPDEKWGEAVKAVVVKVPQAEITDDDLMQYIRGKLGGMKTPKYIDFWEQLPLSPAGKVLKRVVREKYWEDKERRVG
ncbi:MAG: AMP-binding protein [Deltaproteobacteria bacterium]|nr:AMP-binding protein [Deltaproteobacteria bacterium]